MSGEVRSLLSETRTEFRRARRGERAIDGIFTSHTQTQRVIWEDEEEEEDEEEMLSKLHITNTQTQRPIWENEKEEEEEDISISLTPYFPQT